jgi:hypothetical protein
MKSVWGLWRFSPGRAIALMGELAIAGGLMAAYGVPKLILLGTLIVLAYLAWSGTDAIFIATIWVLLLVWGEVGARVWFEGAPEFGTPPWLNKAQTWGIGLVLIWLWGTISVLSLGLTATQLQLAGWTRSQSFQSLSVWTLLSLALGAIIGQQW